MLTKTQILTDLRNDSPRDFVAKHLFDRLPVAFSTRDEFVKWKMNLAKSIGVDAADLTVIGSAAVGISLNPDKAFKEFGPHSDIDIAVISYFHFLQAWRFLRQGKNRTNLPPRQRAAWKDHESRYVYWGTIATDRLLSLLPFAPQWMRASSEASKAPAIANRQVNFRLYTDYEALRGYQVKSVAIAKASLLDRERTP